MAEVEADIARDAQSRAGGRPSLLQDVMRGRRTEIEYLNGYVVAEGRKAGVPDAVQRGDRRGLSAATASARSSPTPATSTPLLEKLR